MGSLAVSNALNVATSCTNLVMFGAVTPEKLLLIFVLFVKKIAKMGISDGLSQNTLDRSRQLVYGIINLTFVLRSLNERCYGNQLIWIAFCKR